MSAPVSFKIPGEFAVFACAQLFSYLILFSNCGSSYGLLLLDIIEEFSDTTTIMNVGNVIMMTEKKR